MVERLILEHPLVFIQDCVREGRLYWSYHVNMRMRERGLSRSMIRKAVNTFEVIDAYPDDKYMPSYLVFAQYDHQVFHVLFAVDVAGDNARVITAYYPDPDQWMAGMKTRRK